MQINTISYIRENPLTYQTKQQENTTSFDKLLFTQSNQTNNINSAEKNQESQKSSLTNFDDFLSEFGVSWDSEEGRTIRTAQLVSVIQQYAKENNMDILKVNWQSANAS